MTDLFISYKKERRAHAERLAAVIEAYGFTVWWDYGLVVGPDFRAQIESNLDAANAVVVLWCSGSIKSRFVRSEAGRADRRNKLVEALLENVEPPVGFGESQAAALIGWDGDPRAPMIEGLITALETKIGRPATPKDNVLRLLSSLPKLPAIHPIRKVAADEAIPDERVAAAAPGRPARAPKTSSRRTSGLGGLLAWTVGGLVLMGGAAYGLIYYGYIDETRLRFWETNDKADEDEPPTTVRLSLSSGFVPDPHEVRVQAGGRSSAAERWPNSNCDGWTPRQPSLELRYESLEFPLYISARALRADTTLVVRTPYGEVLCDDDGGSGDADSGVLIENPSDGRYEIWVGDYDRRSTREATVYISEYGFGSTPREPIGAN